MNFELRNCTLNDLEFIVDLKSLGMKWYIEKLYGWDYEIQKQITISELDKDLNNMKIIVVDGKDVGVTTFSEYDDYFEVGLIVIHPDYQNQGIASRIIKNYIEIANFKKKRIILKTYKENPAQRLYMRLGFNVYRTDSTHLYFEINFNN